MGSSNAVDWIDKRGYSLSSSLNKIRGLSFCLAFSIGLGVTTGYPQTLALESKRVYGWRFEMQ